jgi:type I restriction-modification system DNA methylase subunit
MTRQSGKEAVLKLIEDFEKNERQYMSKSFQETEARNRFIDPFFTALGWELNQTSIARKFWDVHREYSQRDNSTTKKPDYAFRIKEGIKYREKFFVEAKAPHVDLTGNIPVFQAKRYAFSSHGKTPIVILTDFQTFRVFNGLEKPVFENPLQGLIKGLDLEYHTYLDKWDVIWDNFSKEAVMEGSIERLIGKVSRNIKSLDDEFLADISAWREMLARNVAIRNKELSVDHINEAVQRILDRLIFIRNLEDREIETENGLLSTLDVKENIYPHLIPRFRYLDIDYNGLLFKEHFSENIIIGDSVIKDIIKQLYPPKSPYAFDMIEPEILGRIYERFLGSKIRLTESHQAKVEEKPEVRHAGGVYYTPQYIVDYIVENTVGIKIKDKTPEEIEAVKICDPACGSGSFLLGAYQYLLEYHRDWYTKANQTAQKKYKDDFFTNAESEIQLTLKKKTEILKNNIFGVDIDREATEVAIMSLYLKILDDGYDKGQAELFMRGHILPDMTNNIKCGNSLIGTDFYNQGSLDLDDENLNKVNCFDWEGKDGFTEIFKAGGFDVVIGNPPYVNAKTLVELFKNERNYLSNSSRYKSLYLKWDLYIAFIEKSIHLLNNGGYFSMIIPYPFLNQNYGTVLRKQIIENHKLISILDLSNRKIFKDAVVTNIVLTVQKDRVTDKIQINKIDDTNNIIFKVFDINKEIIYQPDSDFSGWNIANRTQINIDFSKCYSLGDICFISKGMVLNADEKHAKGKFVKKDLISKVKTKVHSKKYTEGKYIDRYKINETYYLEWNTNRVPAKISRPTFPELYENPKILINKLGIVKAVYDKSKIYCDQTIRIAVLWYHLKNVQNNSINKYITKARVDLEKLSRQYNELFLLGIINSKMGFYLLNHIRGEKNIDINPEYLKQIPIPALDLSQKADKTKHDNLVSLVEKMLDLKQKEVVEVSDHLKTIITRKNDAVDRTIDMAVYELYNLTTDEIKVVEGKE